MRYSQFAVVAALLCSVGCGSAVTSDPSVSTTSAGRSSEGPAGSTAAKRGNALVRFVNADVESGGADVFSADRKLFSNVAAKAVTGYLEILRGRTQFKLRTVNDTEDVATVGNRELVPGRHYTLVALPKRQGGTRLAILGDWFGLIEPGQTRVRLINATVDVDDLDLFLAGTTTHVAHGIDVGRVRTSSIGEMEPGVVEIRAPGVRMPLTLAKLSVESNRFYTFVVVGRAGALVLRRTMMLAEGPSIPERRFKRCERLESAFHQHACGDQIVPYAGSCPRSDDPPLERPPEAAQRIDPRSIRVHQERPRRLAVRAVVDDHGDAQGRVEIVRGVDLLRRRRKRVARRSERSDGQMRHRHDHRRPEIFLRPIDDVADGRCLSGEGSHMTEQRRQPSQNGRA